MPTNPFLLLNLSLKFVHNIQIPWIINFKIQRCHVKLRYPDWATFSNPITLCWGYCSQPGELVSGWYRLFLQELPRGAQGCSLWKQNYLWLSMSTESTATDQHWPLQNSPAEPHLTLTDLVCHRTCLLVWPWPRSSVLSQPVMQFIPTQRALFAFHRHHEKKTRAWYGRSMKNGKKLFFFSLIISINCRHSSVQ